MASEVTVCNMALVHCGVGAAIASLTEKSPEARACNRFWLETAQEIQRETIWNFNTRIAVLSSIGDTTIAYSTRWPFRFRYPSYCLRAQEILPPRDSDGTIADTVLAGRPTEIPFEVISDDQGRMILTAQENAELRYSHFVESVDLWPNDVRIMASFRLAAYITPGLCKGDKGLLQRSMEFYLMSLSKTREVDAREGVADTDEDGDMNDSRG